MSLHLVFSGTAWQACEARLQEGDTAVLLGDGVYVARTGSAPAAAQPPLHALGEDLTVRGVTPAETIEVIDYAALVELCVAQAPVVSWND